MSKYFEKLKDPRWQKKRLEIFKRAGWKCELCGNDKKSLHIHHNYYSYGFDPWEYENNTLYCLCEDCHLTTQERHGDIALEIAKLPPGYENAIINVLLDLQSDISKKMVERF
jgi:5-methylcytosine-specific restriction endonuclease McrA